MTVEFELSWLIGTLLAFFVACGGVGKLLLHQFQQSMDRQFSAVARRLESMELESREEATQWQRVERELLRFQAELPMNYVRRDDYIRGQSVLEAKLDGLASKIENVQLRAVIHQQRGEPT